MSADSRGTQLGILLWSQATDWAAFEAAARRVDALGYEHLWTWDHLYAIFGDPYQAIWEGHTTLAAWAMVTRKVRLGLMVGANTFRNPGLVAKMATNLDRMSEGRSSGWEVRGSSSSTRPTGSSSARAWASASTGWMRQSRRRVS